MEQSIHDVLEGWSPEDLQNLGALLEMNGRITVEAIAAQFSDRYHSRVIGAIGGFFKGVKRTLDKRKGLPPEALVQRPPPSYDVLLKGACEHVKAAESGATTRDRELHLTLAVIVAALAAMSSTQRVKFFTETVDPASLATGADIPGVGLGGPATTAALLGAAQLSGFGIYMAATTALGFITHAAGITLPFVLYTGLTSTIAFVIGPAGWLALGAWTTWNIIQPEWKKIIPALVYIIARNSRGDTLVQPGRL